MGVAVGDVIRVTAKMTVSGNDLQNVFHFLAEGTGEEDNADVTDDAALEMDGLYDLVDQHLSSGVVFETVYVWNVTDDNLVGEVPWPVLTVGGGGAAESTAFQLAAVLRFITNTARSQGRKFIGLLIKTSIGDAGRVTTQLETDLGTLATNMLGGFSSGGLSFQPGNYNYTLLTFAPWIAAIVNEYLGTQRRRKGGIGS